MNRVKIAFAVVALGTLLVGTFVAGAAIDRQVSGRPDQAPVAAATTQTTNPAGSVGTEFDQLLGQVKQEIRTAPNGFAPANAVAAMNAAEAPAAEPDFVFTGHEEEEEDEAYEHERREHEEHERKERREFFRFERGDDD